MSEPLRSLLAASGCLDRGVVAGLSDDEIARVREDQGVDRLPARYVEFLSSMGASAGCLLVGTDAFYPNILGVKADAVEMASLSGISSTIPANAVVFAMHQGYQVYLFEDAESDDPPVLMYQEGRTEVQRRWASFTEFLMYEAGRSA